MIKGEEACLILHEHDDDDNDDDDDDDDVDDEKLVHIVGFTIEIHHDARPCKRQKANKFFFIFTNQCTGDFLKKKHN
jgi:hypothetical protein